MDIGQISSIGYQQRSLTELLDLLEGANVDVVVDVRETPWSYRREFAKGNLTARLAERCIEYVHAKFAGNPKAIRRSAESHREVLTSYRQHLEKNDDILWDFDALVGNLVREGKNVCLICYERHPEDCHRHIVLDGWMTRLGIAPDVLHLGPEGCARFT